jgi:hypothetical protein
LDYFYYGKSIVYVEIIFFRSKFDEVSPKKKTLGLGSEGNGISGKALH